MSNVTEQANKALSKQSSPQLLSKINAGKLFGASKDAAIAILKKRGVDIDKPTEKKRKEAPIVEKEEKTTSTKTEKVKKETKETKKPSFPEYGKKVKFVPSKQSGLGDKKITGTITAKVKGSRNPEKYYFNIRVNDKVFQKSPDSIEFVD